MKSFAKLVLTVCFHAIYVRSEVGRDFEKCKEFFYKSTPPQLGDTYSAAGPAKSICQKYNDRYHFATYYSTGLRVAFYSAYTLPDPCPGGLINRQNSWFIEPQVSYGFDAKFSDIT